MTSRQQELVTMAESHGGKLEVEVYRGHGTSAGTALAKSCMSLVEKGVFAHPLTVENHSDAHTFSSQKLVFKLNPRPWHNLITGKITQ